MEIWKEVNGFERYEVSTFGRIRNKETGKYKKNIKNWAGYMRVQLNKGRDSKIFSVHRLVVLAFIPNLNNYPESNHIDHNRQNNNVENLEWCTRSYNATHSFKRPDRKISRAWLGKKGALFHASKQIVQIKNAEIINRFPSATTASEVLGYHQVGISRCCRGQRKSYKGFQWEFA